MADDLRLFGVTGDWKTAALDPGAWYNTVQEGGCRFMSAWATEEESASNQRQKKNSKNNQKLHRQSIVLCRAVEMPKSHDPPR